MLFHGTYVRIRRYDFAIPSRGGPGGNPPGKKKTTRERGLRRPHFYRSVNNVCLSPFSLPITERGAAPPGLSKRTEFVCPSSPVRHPALACALPAAAAAACSHPPFAGTISHGHGHTHLIINHNHLSNPYPYPSNLHHLQEMIAIVRHAVMSTGRRRGALSCLSSSSSPAISASAASNGSGMRRGLIALSLKAPPAPAPHSRQQLFFSSRPKDKRLEAIEKSEQLHAELKEVRYLYVLLLQQLVCWSYLYSVT